MIVKIKKRKNSLKSEKKKKLLSKNSIKRKKSKSQKIKSIKKTLKKKSKKIPPLKKVKSVKKKFYLIKPDFNPIILPNKENWWENWQTFNPGVILLGDKVHFLYRAIGQDGISRLGYANSLDGFFINERLNYPVFEHKSNSLDNLFYNFYKSGGSFFGVEDPRLVKICGESKIYMTYTACHNGLSVGLTSINEKDFLNKNWCWAKPKIISKPNEVHKNWVIFPEKINGQYAILTSLNPEILISYRDNLEFNEGEYLESYYDARHFNKNSWDYLVRGIGPPPLKTKYGWLVFYQAMSKDEFDKYKIGAMILDSNNPKKILVKSLGPVLEPDKNYENFGFKKGVVYATGAVVKDNLLLIYYGSADSYIAVAFCEFEEFLTNLLNEKEIRFKKSVVKVKK